MFCIMCVQFGLSWAAGDLRQVSSLGILAGALDLHYVCGVWLELGRWRPTASKLTWNPSGGT
jgi:hypothetical protein